MSNDANGIITTILRKAATIRATSATGGTQFAVSGNGDVWVPQGTLVGSCGFNFGAQDGTGGMCLSPYTGFITTGSPPDEFEGNYFFYGTGAGAGSLGLRVHPTVGSKVAGLQVGGYSGGGSTVPVNDAYVVLTGWQNNLWLASSGGYAAPINYGPAPFTTGDSVISTTNLAYQANSQTDRLYICDWYNGLLAYKGGFNDGGVFSWYEGYLRGLKIGFKASASGDATARLDVNVDNAHPTQPITAGVSITGTYNITNTSGFISSLIGTTNIRPKGTGLAVAPTFFNSTGPHYGEYIAPVANNASALTYGLFVTMQGATQGNLSAYSGVFIGQGFGINTALPGSSMTIVGSVSMSQVAKSSNYTLTGTDRIVFGNAASAPVYLTLPSSTNISGRTYTVKKTDATANAIVVGTAVGNSLDGVTASFLTSQYAKITFVSDNGNNWYTV